MKKGKIDFDLSSLSLQELLKVYETIDSFLAFLDESKVEEGEESDEQ